MFGVRCLRQVVKPTKIFTRFSSCGPQKCIGNAALIAGGLTGIGLQFAKTLLDNGVSKIVIGGADKKAGEEEVKKLRQNHRNSSICFAQYDAAKCEEVERLFECAMSTFGCIDIVCNQARIFNEAKWSTMVDVNLKSSIAGSLLAVKCMSKEKGGNGGTVINVGSILGLQPLAGSPVYCATKHGVVGFTRSMGMPYHYKKTGIRFMTMCPGLTNTTMKRLKAPREATPLVQQMMKEVQNLPLQDVCHVGLCLMEMLTRGENGSVWIVEDKEVYEIIMPNRLCFQRRC